jgi:hypothetical protein
MKDLTTLSNDELIKAYYRAEAEQEAEHQMDGSGECGHLIDKAFEPVWEAFEKEFERRQIQISDCYSSDMPA